ncbi:hypothetical protein [Tepidibacter formicigenes]|jgi:hypothetical protein|uniref:Uncharacterized protein n=1 Tax=Tepidibacter formicigenes DSM 15518 TaxID=1123349 RepID=A0A1M6PT32_9FIRM|nr:hypothetical protein [Tepidibacter formicigenes]SHK11065.1 hypothetical protein SAMN02744037_01643 [Tepidibacter formicigenes DSM 15518]
MDLTKIENLFNEEINFNELKQNTINYIKNLLENYKDTFLIECIDDLPEDMLFKDLDIEYKRTEIILNKDCKAKPSFRLVFKLINPITEDPLYIYEVEYNNSGEFSDEFLIDYYKSF